MVDLEILNGEYITTNAAPAQYAATMVGYLYNVMQSPAQGQH